MNAPDKRPIRILGISAFYHDSAAALVIDGEVVAAASEERFTRKKYDQSFPRNAVRYCLSEAGVSISELDAVVFYDKPRKKFGRLMATYVSFAPYGIESFVAAMHEWIGKKLFTRALLRNELTRIANEPDKVPPILFCEHHLSHAGSAFYPSPFERSAILTIDGVGEWATTTIGLGEKNRITILKEMRFPHSVGLLYAAFTSYCGFKVNSGEYKLMGLAPYGDPGSARVERYKHLIHEHLIDLKTDGSLFLNMEYFDFAAGMHMCNEEKWETLFSLPRRNEGDELTQEYMDMALAIQETTNEILLSLANTAKELTGATHLVMAGGVALNCVSNYHLRASGLFDDIWIQPAAGDAGGALGAALSVHHMYFGQPRTPMRPDAMRGSCLGPSYSDTEIVRFLKKENAPYRSYENFDELAKGVAHLLSEGNVVGWFQGRMEWGPRALGKRSIIADPRNSEMQRKLNLKIKYREGFRPFAPSVLEEDASEYFDSRNPSPYMLFTAPVVKRRRKPPAPLTASLSERLNRPRSDIPAVTHLDYSARLQTVSRNTNERYWSLINEFKKKTGYGLVVNTSFNVRGEPIVCTPEEAYRCFMDTEMDYLVLGNILIDKREQKTVSREKPRAYAED